ncbi:MAG: GDSL-type esterase/lipase family protein [Candidatus Obscuribacterales bacterium]|nr:GDSL-type esterase/lipase family protein [Candidatus Obscuribacterales bacterium]
MSYIQLSQMDRSSGLLAATRFLAVKASVNLVIQMLIVFDTIFDFAMRLLRCGSELPVSVDQPLDRFEDDIRSFEAMDVTQPPLAGGIVFIGSSTFAHAASRIEAEFADMNAICRAFGGSTIPEVNHYLSRVVLKYQPARICFYAGTNDIADGHCGRRVYRDFLSFVKNVQAVLPAVEIYFVSMSAAPSRLQWVHQYVVGNRLVRYLSRCVNNLHYIDVVPVMYDARGNFHGDWFLEDQLHMNSLGYDAWFPIIRRSLTGDKEH